MIKKTSHCAWLFLLLASALFQPTSSRAFFSYSTDNAQLSLGGFVGAGGSVAKYPGDGFYTESSDGSWFGDIRLLADGSVGENLAASINVLQNVRTTPVLVFSGSDQFQRDVERSGVLYWQQHDSKNTQSAMVLDSAYVKYGNRNNELTVGRQPITTTVTFFFTPNDFFAPFSPNTFFKVYKPGVDAVRYERRLESLSQLSVIGVFGYESQDDSESGWSDAPDWQRTSMLARMNYTLGEFEWAGVLGAVRESVVTGLSLQGEFFEWLGIRAEGHHAESWVDDQESGVMATVSLEHRFASSLTMRLEYMYNGFASDSIPELLSVRDVNASGQGYLGRHYSALDFSYEITPLLFGEILYLRNWTDNSYIMSFNAVFSVSDESELALTASLPGGSEPDSGAMHSELGSLPVQFALEYRHFF